MSDFLPTDHSDPHYYPVPGEGSSGGTLAIALAVFAPLLFVFLLGLGILLWNRRLNKKAARARANAPPAPDTDVERAESVTEPPPAYIGVLELPGNRAKQEEGSGDAGSERLGVAN